MAKLTLTDLASLQNETSVITTINNNNDAIEQAMEKTLTRDGTSPNSLSAQLDMNTNKIINLAKGTTTGEALEYSQLQEKVDDINTIYNQAVTAKNQAQAAQSGAELAESNAEAAEAQAEDILLEIQTIFDTYNNQFIGTFTSDPTVDNDGNPLTVGDIYYNSIFLSMRVWDGAAWQDIAAMTPTSHNEISNKVYINPVFRGTFLPETSDGVALGSSSYMFSDLFLAAGAVINFNASDVTITHNTNSLAFAGASSGYSFDARISRDSQFFMDMTTAPFINWDNNDYISYDRGSNLYNFVIGSTVEAVLSGTELRPGSNDGSALGTTSSSWADLFLASGAVINFANGNYTLTHSSGLLNFSGSGQFGNTLFVSGGYSGAYSGGSSALKFGGGGSNPNAAAIGWGDGSGWILNLGYNSSSVFTPRYQFVDNGAFRPATSDAAVLGDTTHMWSDLFLASGGVVNFNNGDFTLTHSSGILTANKDIQITTAGTNSTSVVTVGGTQTLTNKTLTNPIVGTQSQGDNSTKAASTAYVDRTTREVLTANRTYYVRTDGSDSNNGLANTSGGAFLTIQKAINSACALDLSVYAVTINVADGSYGAFNLKNYVGVGPINIIGNVTTPANVNLSGSSTNISGTAWNCRYIIKGMKVANSAGNAIAWLGPGVVEINNLEFGACSAAHIRLDNSCLVSGINGSFKISGAAAYSWLVGFGSQLNLDSSTITYSASVAYSQSNCYAQHLGFINLAGVTFALGGNTITGKRYTCYGVCSINTNGAGASFVPGDVAGTSTGFQGYN